jgi:RHS repeat-associated protein
MNVSNIVSSQAYNDAGQMTSAGNGVENFTYAGASQDEVLSDGSATGITYGLPGQAGQPWVQSYTPAAGGTDYVLRDQNGTPLGYEQNGTEYAFVTDNIGSVTNVVSSCGCTDASYAYDPYGNLTSESGSNAGDNLLLYTGALTDPFGTGTHTGYVHDGNRWYSPATGSFTTQDTNSYLDNPADGNRYAYAADNPVNYIDPTGQGIWGDVLSYGLTVVGAAIGVVGVVVTSPILIIGGAILGVAALGIATYQMECTYGGESSIWTIPGQCTVF